MEKLKLKVNKALIISQTLVVSYGKKEISGRPGNYCADRILLHCQKPSFLFDQGNSFYFNECILGESCDLYRAPGRCGLGKKGCIHTVHCGKIIHIL